MALPETDKTRSSFSTIVSESEPPQALSVNARDIVITSLKFLPKSIAFKILISLKFSPFLQRQAYRKKD